MDISKFDDAIQKAIINFETEVEKIKSKKLQKEQNLKITLQNIQKDVALLKNVLAK